MVIFGLQMDERIFIERLINLIEQHVDRGPVEEWTNHNFFLLSCDIEEKTGHRISESTLKRILGKKKTSKRFYNPQIQTKDILAGYLDYPSWHAFKNDLTGSARSEAVNKPGKRIVKKKGPARLALYMALPLISVILIILLDPRKDDITFTPRSISGTVPYTAIFDYDLAGISDSVYVNFGNYETFHLDPDKDMITEFYRSAAVPTIRVYTEKKRLATFRVHNITGTWQAGSSPNDTMEAYRPFEPQPDFMQGDTMYVSPSTAAGLGVSTGKPHWIEFRKTDNLGISLDSIEFTCSIRNSPETGGRRCYDAEIFLLGSNSDIRLKFIEPGCFSFVALRFSEKTRNGRFEDLSDFAVDLSDWGNIKVTTRGGTASVFFNEDRIFTEQYEQALGDLWGVIFRFYGSGAAASVRINKAAL